MRSHSNRSASHQLIQLGSTGLGAGAKPNGPRAAEEAIDRIKGSIGRREQCCSSLQAWVAGTGHGGAALSSRASAKEMGILTVGVVTKPSTSKAPAHEAADAGLAELEANVDSLIVILNDKLLDVLGDDVTQDQASRMPTTC